MGDLTTEPLDHSLLSASRRSLTSFPTPMQLDSPNHAWWLMPRPLVGDFWEWQRWLHEHLKES